MLMARRRTLYLPALLGTLVAVVLMACAVALSTVSEKAEATFPGKNGRIAYSAYGKKIVYAGLAGLERNNAESDIYKINAFGRNAKTKLTNNNKYDTYPSYSPDGKKIVYTVSKGNAAIRGDIYTINAFGGSKTKLTHNNTYDTHPSWGSRP